MRHHASVNRGLACWALLGLFCVTDDGLDREGGRRITLRKKLILAFTILFAALGSSIGYLSCQDAERIVYANKQNEMADTVNRVDININTWVMQVTGLAENTCRNQAVSALLLKRETTKSQQNYIDEWFHNFAQVFMAVSNIYILDGEGKLRYSYESCGGFREDRGQVLSTAAKAKPDREIWLGSGSPLCGSSQNGVVTMVKEVCLPDEMGGSIPAGTLVIELKPDVFAGMLLSNHSLFPNQYTLIVDQKGQVISTNKRVEHAWLTNIEQSFDEGIRKQELRLDGKNYYVCGQYNGLTGWKTFSIVSLSDFFPQSRQLQKRVLLIASLAVLLAAAVISILSYAFTHPVAELVGAMKRVEEGDFAVRVAYRGRDEMGCLMASFNFMTDKIRHLVKEVYQEKLAQKNAELEALQAQINPHFLYNTLDSINWMLIDLQAYEISDVVVSLGDILKYSIQDGDALVTLDEEFRYIESYLCIQKNRLEERLHTSVVPSEEAKGCLVPRLILQPVVENGIRHGIEPVKEGGIICIAASVRDGDLILTVSDDGEGMDEEALRHLREAVYAETVKPASNEREAGGEGKTVKKTGIGLRNVHRRLQLHFGKEYGLMIDSRPFDGVTVTLRIPAGKGEANGHRNC